MLGISSDRIRWSVQDMQLYKLLTMWFIPVLKLCWSGKEITLTQYVAASFEVRVPGDPNLRDRQQL